jgi:hypothetical protein
VSLVVLFHVESVSFVPAAAGRTSGAIPPQARSMGRSMARPRAWR